MWDPDAFSVLKGFSELHLARGMKVTNIAARHCEEQSDEAIQNPRRGLVASLSLAMTSG